MASRSAQVLLLALCALAAVTVVNAFSLSPINTLADIAGSGFQLPTRLPTPTNTSAFQGKKVLFVIGNGAEDHEVYYQHQYFADRGASISFVCVDLRAGNVSAIADFFKPSYIISCLPVDKVNFHNFDLVMVPGGLPSSTEMRSSPLLMVKLWDYYLSGGSLKRPSGKLLAIICSGSEVTIDSGIITDIPKVTGTTFSAFALMRALESISRPDSDYVGFNPDGGVVSYPSTFLRSALVIGRDPSVSAQFVTAIGSLWVNLNEPAPVLPTDGVPLNMVNGFYQSPQLVPVTSLSQLPPSDPSPSPAQIPVTTHSFEGKTVVFAAGTGVSDWEFLYLYKFFVARGAEPVLACADWQGPAIYLYPFPMLAPTYMATCDMTFSQLASAELPDVVVIPGGALSNGAYVRNDNNLLNVLWTMANSTDMRTIALFSEGQQVLVANPNMLLSTDPVSAAPTVRRDLSDAGFPIRADSSIVGPTISGKFVMGWNEDSGRGLQFFARALDQLWQNGGSP